MTEQTNDQIALMAKETIRLDEVPAVVQEIFKRDVSVRTVRYWVTRGRRGIKLRAMNVCGAYYTTIPWLMDFWEGREPEEPEAPAGPAPVVVMMPPAAQPNNESA